MGPSRFAPANPPSHSRVSPDMSVERTLHHFPLDPGSRQVRLVLGEKRLPFTDV
ncbi:MAG: Glutathione S-transferase domain protein, partial [Phenylobacterium sp.]|nr:Glutathione S-transferase domain protein [Phenylobacterium sp.]